MNQITFKGRPIKLN